MKTTMIKCLAIFTVVISAFALKNSAACECGVSFPIGTTLNAYVTVYPNWTVPDANNPSYGLTDPPAWFAVDVLDRAAPISSGIYPAWCIDQENFLPATQVRIPGTFYSGTLISTCDPIGLNYLPFREGNPPVGPPPIVTTSTWHKINYILNHKSAYYWWNVEVAINRLVGGPAPNDPLNVLPPVPTNFPPVNTNEVNAILADASANAASWTPHCGDSFGVIFLIPDPTLGVPVQLIMLEVSCKCPECDGQIGDFVWNDSDGDGCQDRGEAGIAGVRVDLYEGCGVSGSPIKTTTTDSMGHYLFGDLCAGTYTVSFNTPAGYTRTTANAGCNINGKPADETDSDCNCAAGTSCGVCVTLPEGDSVDMSIDCGYVCDGQIGDFVWNDSNGNGCQDTGEAGIAGVTVNLYAGCGVSGTPIKTMVTDNRGRYLFDDLCVGTYTISFNTPAGYARTTANANCDVDGKPAEETDSDCDCAAVTACGVCVTLTPANLVNMNIDCGYICDGQIGDFVWNDLNGDGCQDANEAGIAGVTVNLYAGCGVSGTPIKTMTTDSTGQYLFSGLCAGTYTVSFNTPAGYRRTTANAVCNIGGKPAEETDSDCDCAAGTACGVCVTLTPANLVNMNVDCGYVCDGQIGDFVWNDLNGDGCQDANEAGIAGVTVNLYAGCGVSGTPIKTMTTDSTGQYLFSGLCAGTYTVSFNTPAGYRRTTANAVCNIGGKPAEETDSDCDCAAGTACGVCVTLTPANLVNMNVDCGYVCDGQIGDFVWNDLNGDGCQDANEAGIAGVTVNLYAGCGVSGTPIKTMTTDSTGQYLFSGLCAGTYTVSFNTPAGYRRTTANAVCNIGGKPAEETDSDCDCAAGTACGVCVTLTPANLVNMNVDCGYVCDGQIGDFVWNDLNGDGCQDANEAGIAGVTVNLYAGCGVSGTPIKTMITDNAGQYLFSGLCVGTYTVSFNTPAGYARTTANSVCNIGGKPSEETDSDCDCAAGTACGVCVTLTTAKWIDMSVDCGYVCDGKIGDFVWNDTNGNGCQDANEAGIDGVRVDLYTGCGISGSPIKTTTTTITGRYVFSNLCAGTYTVSINIPPEYVRTTANAGCNVNGEPPDNMDSDCDCPAGVPCGICVTLTAANPVAMSIDCGGVKPASIGDFVWEDKNANGIQDPNEPGIAGATVRLTDCSGNSVTNINGILVGPITTGANGFYKFIDLKPGQYQVAVTLPSGYMFTVPFSGGDPTKDSNIDPVTGKSDCRTLVSEQYDDTVDAGAYRLACLGDWVWEDLNADGIQNDGLTGIGGVSVSLHNCVGGALISTKTTGPDGKYQFCDLKPGSYYLVFGKPAGYVYSKPGQGADRCVDSDADGSGKTICVTLVSGQIDNCWDTGLHKPASIGDFVWEDKNANGVQDANEPGISNAVVRLTDCSGNPVTDINGILVGPITTGASGFYQFTNLPPAQYQVAVTLPSGGYVFTVPFSGTDPTKDSNIDPVTGKSDCRTLVSGQYDDTVDAGVYRLACLGDWVWEDLNADGIQNDGLTGIGGVSVSLHNCVGDALISTKTTGPDGKYQFCDLKPGSYYLVFGKPAGYVYSKPGQGTDRCTDSDANGSGKTICVTLVSGQIDNCWDTGLHKPASIGDFVWEDKNVNGIQDPNEPGISNAVVRLTDCSGNPVTDINGNLVVPIPTGASGFYQFTNLPPAQYQVMVTLPSGYVFTVPFSGVDPTKDSNITPAMGKSDCRTLVSGQYDNTVDAGAYRPQPGLQLMKSADKDVVFPGGRVVYTYVVTNTGNVTIRNIKLVDDNGTPSDPTDDIQVGTIPSLPPAMSQTFAITNTIPQPWCMTVDGVTTLIGYLSAEVLSSGDIKVTYSQQNVNDNRYGTNATVATGWNRSHSFKDLVGSDKAEFRFTDSKDNVVLDFYCDYISASTSFPSGYGSLGVSGGEGKMIIGSASNVISATTSMSENLKKTTFQTAYLVNSPPETAPLSDISIPAGWDYTNSYTVVVSKNAFGANGFKGITIPTVHNSPSKIKMSIPTNCDHCVSNTAVVTATSADGVGATTLTARAVAQVCVGTPPPPGMSLIKTPDKTVISPNGESVTYSYTVRNTGAQTIDNIAVMDDNGTPNNTADDFLVGTIPSLAPGTSARLTATRTLTPSLQPKAMCMTINNSSVVVGYLTTTDLGDKIKVEYVQEAVNDNRYGTGATAATGWNRNRSFSDLVGSDKAEFRFTDSKGNVVLDFYVDYISASRTFPSGYGSLGVSGGEGKMVVGSTSDVLSATTSLSENLKKPAFQTGYLVNSPLEGTAGWDYMNSYTVEVSKNVFGANGFGGVTIPGVHNSPPKLGNNLTTPSNCNACVVNVAVAAGTAADGDRLTAQATAQVCFGTLPPPGMSLIKTPDKTVISPDGDSVTYTYTVKNTGAQPISNITVVDDNGTSDPADDFSVGTIPSLAPGVSTTLAATRTLTPPLQPKSMCMMINNSSVVVGYLTTTVLPSGDIQVEYVQEAVNDNRYGTGATAATGWPKGHTFQNLVGSDKAEFRFTDSEGNVVLDFYCDYISASSTFPSGYGSLGVSGGEGKMVVGSASDVISATTSLSENLKKPAFQTGYLVNSPLEGTAGWDYKNSYMVVVSKNAFGANGFGGVAIPGVHNSPPKMGDNLVTPKPCNPCVVNTATATGMVAGVTLRAQATAQVCFGTPPTDQICEITKGTLKIDKNKIQLSLKNDGAEDIFLSELILNWPQAVNGTLKKVSLNGDVWGGSANAPVDLISLDFDAFDTDTDKRKIAEGQTKTLTLEFEKNVSKDTTLYSGTVRFGADSSCIITLP